MATKATTPRRARSGTAVATPARKAANGRPAARGEGRNRVEAGRSHPLGATPDKDGVNFSVFSENASAVTLLIFDEHDSPEPVMTIDLDAKSHHKTFHFWHCYVRGLKAGAHYAYRVDGPPDLHGRGFRFN